jgi:PGAP1-like protein
MKVVGIHGIWNPADGEKILRDWLPSLQIGLKAAGFPEIAAEDFSIVSYADVFQTKGARGSGLDEDSLDEDLEWDEEFLLAIWEELAEQERRVQGPEVEGRGKKGDIIQEGIRQIVKSPLFQVGGEHLVMAILSQVRRYLKNEKIKAAIQARVFEKVTSKTQVIIGHSLGSVVAYECLCKPQSDWNVQTLLTLGSPLGISPSVFDRLQPQPTNGSAVYPSIKQWTNVADSRDPVALEKRLSSRFGKFGAVQDYLVTHSDEKLTKMHDVAYYLRSQEAGRAIGVGLGL